MKRSRTRSPGLNNAVQFAQGDFRSSGNVGGAVYIGDVGRGHVRASPRQAVRYRGAQAFAFYVFDKSAGCTLVEVVIIALFFELLLMVLGFVSDQSLSSTTYSRSYVMGSLSRGSMTRAPHKPSCS